VCPSSERKKPGTFCGTRTATQIRSRALGYSITTVCIDVECPETGASISKPSKSSYFGDSGAWLLQLAST
jgi:hypothetical protein